MPRYRVLALPVVTATLALALTACGGGAKVPSIEAGEGYDPGNGPLVKGSGYTLHAPDGWKDITSTVKSQQSSVDKAFSSTEATDGFRPNLNVIVTEDAAKGEPTEADFDKGEKELTSQLESAGAKNVHVQPRVELGDTTAIHVSANAAANGVSYLTDQYITIHDGNAYTLTFSFPGSTQETQENDLKGPSLQSFEFTD